MKKSTAQIIAGVGTASLIAMNTAFAGGAVLGALPEDAPPGRALFVTLLLVSELFRGGPSRRGALRRRLSSGKRGPPAAPPRTS